MTFFDTSACQSRSHCHACRTSQPFRESIHRLGQAASVDFACPHGITAASLPAPRQFRVRFRKKGCASCTPIEVVSYAEPAPSIKSIPSIPSTVAPQPQVRENTP